MLMSSKPEKLHCQTKQVALDNMVNLSRNFPRALQNYTPQKSLMYRSLHYNAWT